jgi:hypothetical protein
MVNIEPDFKTRAIHDLISKLLDERGEQSPSKEELGRDPNLACGNITRYYALGDLDISQCESFDGFVGSWVIKGKECFFKDRSYDGELFGIDVYITGEWEDILKQEDKKEFDYGCNDEEWISWWRENINS